MEETALENYGAISEEDAKNQFLDYLDDLQEWSKTPGIPDYGYRVDTWQLWAKCDGKHEEGCPSPGVSITVAAPDPKPFAVMIGPYVLYRERNIADAFARMIRETSFYIQTAIGHQHIFGQPHHESCALCDELPAG